MGETSTNSNNDFSVRAFIVDLLCGGDHGAVLGGLFGAGIWYLIVISVLGAGMRAYDLLCVSSFVAILVGAGIGALIGRALDRSLH